MASAKSSYRKAFAKETARIAKDREKVIKEKSRREIVVTNVYDRNVDSKKTVLLNKGGTGSTKSYSIAQLYIQMLISGSGREMLVARKTLPSLKMSSYKLVLTLLKDYGYYEFISHNKSDMTLSYTEVKHGKVVKENNMYFKSLDDVRKLKSVDFTNIWLEEATEDTLNDFQLLRMRLRAKAKDNIYRNQMHLTFNPIDQNHWIAETVVGKPEVELINSTYKDNPFLTPEYIEYIEDLKNISYNLYRVYVLNEWGVLENIIYDNWEEVSPEVFDSISTKDEFYGLDFGIVHATVLEHIKLYEGKVYIKEEIYECKKTRSAKVFTNGDLIERMNMLFVGRDKKRPIYADSAEPNRIDEIYRAGYNIHPANKDVLAGIDTCSRNRMYICGINTLREIKGYCRMKDKNNNVLANPIKAMDDCMDAVRYGVFTHAVKYGRFANLGDIKRASQQKGGNGNGGYTSTGVGLGNQYDI